MRRRPRVVLDTNVVVSAHLKSEGFERFVLDLAIAEKLIQKSGAWFSMDGENLGQGRENTRQFLKENPEFADKLDKAIRKNAGLVKEKMIVDEKDDEAKDKAAPAKA